MRRPRRLIESALRWPDVKVAGDQWRAPDGSRFDIELRYLPVRYGGEPHVLASAATSPTARSAERALRDSEAQYRAIFNASADALVLRDADFRIVDVNATYERMSGYAAAEVLGVDRIIANPAEVAPRIRALHAARAGRRDGRAARCRSAPRRHALRDRAARRADPAPRPAARAVHRPRHHRAQARRAALRDSEAQYRAIFNASADALLLRDAEHRASRSTRRTWA